MTREAAARAAILAMYPGATVECFIQDELILTLPERKPTMKLLNPEPNDCSRCGADMTRASDYCPPGYGAPRAPRTDWRCDACGYECTTLERKQ